MSERHQREDFPIWPTVQVSIHRVSLITDHGSTTVDLEVHSKNIFQFLDVHEGLNAVGSVQKMSMRG